MKSTSHIIELKDCKTDLDWMQMKRKMRILPETQFLSPILQASTLNNIVQIFWRLRFVMADMISIGAYR